MAILFTGAAEWREWPTVGSNQGVRHGRGGYSGLLYTLAEGRPSVAAPTTLMAVLVHEPVLPERGLRVVRHRSDRGYAIDVRKASQCRHTWCTASSWQTSLRTQVVASGVVAFGTPDYQGNSCIPHPVSSTSAYASLLMRYYAVRFGSPSSPKPEPGTAVLLTTHTVSYSLVTPAWRLDTGSSQLRNCSTRHRPVPLSLCTDSYARLADSDTRRGALNALPRAVWRTPVFLGGKKRRGTSFSFLASRRSVSL